MQITGEAPGYPIYHDIQCTKWDSCPVERQIPQRSKSYNSPQQLHKVKLIHLQTRLLPDQLLPKNQHGLFHSSSRDQ